MQMGFFNRILMTLKSTVTNPQIHKVLMIKFTFFNYIYIYNFFCVKSQIIYDLFFRPSLLFNLFITIMIPMVASAQYKIHINQSINCYSLRAFDFLAFKNYVSRTRHLFLYWTNLIGNSLMYFLLLRMIMMMMIIL